MLNQSVIGFDIGLFFALRPALAVAALTELIELIASGQVKVQVGARMALSDAAQGHRLLETRHSTGKIILHP